MNKKVSIIEKYYIKTILSLQYSCSPYQNEMTIILKRIPLGLDSLHKCIGNLGTPWQYGSFALLEFGLPWVHETSSIRFSEEQKQQLFLQSEPEYVLN